VNRDQFDHAIRAAAAVVGESEVLVIGSQAVHASIPDSTPDAARRSVEADIAIRGDVDGTKADLIDGSIGEASMFHQTFGFYAQGVTLETAILPKGWEKRLVRYETPETNGVVAWCLSLEDLFVSKALAGRPKDLELCRSIVQLGVVDTAAIAQMLSDVKAVDSKKEVARALLGYSDHSGPSLK
jgi:hypothetical protein